MNFFVGGLPRSGTSLLSTLINAHPEVSCAQDTVLMPALKYGFCDILQQNSNLEEFGIPSHLSAERLSWLVNLESNKYNTDIIHKAIKMPISTMLSTISNESTFMSNVISKYILSFYLLGFQQPDPRKDRAKAIQYLRCFDIQGILNGHDNYLDMCEKMWKNFSSMLLHKDSNRVSLYGEKHPTNLISSDMINICFPSAKFICLVRHPNGVLGAKKDRGYNINTVLNDYLLAGPFLQHLTRKQTIFIRYEDLIVNPSYILNKIFSFLGVSPLEQEVFTRILNQGTYQKYVGASIDPNRNYENLKKVTPKESKILSQKLNSFLDKFYPSS